LVTDDEEVPAPDVINKQVFKRRPRDTVDGPPHVTCKSWVIVDAESGRVLDGWDADKPLDMASTTKIMTAHVALRQCQRNPKLLDEVIVFSKRADETAGSTAGVRGGERVPVKELLFGLLLPSGNDAAVALAEFFGRHVDSHGNGGGDTETIGETTDSEITGTEITGTEITGTEITDGESYDRFIAAMNRAGANLGLEHSSFKNPHGLTAPGHTASAADLATLSRATLQDPLFREIVSTRQRGYTVEAEAGYRRNLFWKNTNRLLNIEGYQGVKTGTTNAAGACLVSHGERDGKALIIVVLGASSSDARYVDTRNLFRWAWNKVD
jgi:D-alanyl-D-alanine carboxypeptidase (penicillin-binding protein 5/6)